MELQTQRERHARIKEALIRDGEVRSADLAKAFSVSIETIRRDLVALERKGQAQRMHGGAMPMGAVQGLAHIGTRMSSDREAKERIGKLAAKQVEPGMSVFIGGGSTALAAAWEMRTGVRASFATHMLDVVMALSVGGQDDITVFGGNFSSQSRTFYGFETIEMIGRRAFDIAFLGASAVDPARGLLGRGEKVVELAHAVRRCARKVVVLATNTAFARTDRFTALMTNEIDVLVTDAAPEVRAYAALDAAGVEMVY